MAKSFSKPFYNSKEWEKVRAYCLMREHNIGNPAIALNPDNLVSLCRDCHFARHRGDQVAGRNKHAAGVLPEITFDENGNAVVIPPWLKLIDGGMETAGRPNNHYG